MNKDLNESIELELRAPEKSGLLIQEITGLGPSKANINTTELSTIDGSIFNSSRVTSRNIVFTLKLMDLPSVEVTRLLSYKYFPIKQKIRIRVETDNRTSDIYGYVESNEPVMFSNQSTTQISVICPDPYFYSSNMNVITFAGTVPVFSFPFYNDLVTTIYPPYYTGSHLIMGDINMNQETNISYLGDAEIGFNIFIHSIGAVKNLMMVNSITNQIMKIDHDKLVTLTGHGIIDGDDIIISTIKGQKSITLIRGGIYYNILNCLDIDVVWFQLVRGDNTFAFYTELGLDNLQFRIENQTVYEGV